MSTSSLFNTDLSFAAIGEYFEDAIQPIDPVRLLGLDRAQLKPRQNDHRMWLWYLWFAPRN